MTTRPAPGIVHLGIGAFFRAFGIPWIEDAMANVGGDWGVIGVSLRRPDVRDTLAPRNFRYSCVEMGPATQTVRTIDALRDVLVAPDGPDAVLRHMADATIHIISLTVTEKGYCHDPATGLLNHDHPDIRHDLQQPLPRSAPGYLLRALQRRHAAGTPPPTILSCDNLPGNGRLLGRLVQDMAQQVDPDLASWIATHVTFPQTMVDRIVPATTDADIATHTDPGVVVHEPFRQWVIEDRFAGPRPALDRVGVQFVQDVAPFEDMKLRMLNGAHSALAYLGYLAGHRTVSDAMADPVFARFLGHLWRAEIIPTLTTPENTNLSAYADDLRQRFANPALRHRLWQIAMDGSQKLPQRLLGTLADRIAAHQRADGLLLTVAAWMQYVSGTDLTGAPIDVRDPMADRLATLCANSGTPADRVRALLSVADVFDPVLAGRIETDLIRAYEDLRTNGIATALQGITK